ncbi:hypothetical protein [Xenorhabdus szentirmaii]|uniref:Uncharacterized protein n=1 Tax=Xenorhabdus szentirmaii DSM 16338 TaxID=1427518 RepID=W1ISF9_9GAMM|nr:MULTISPECIES: hypothetical protein [Xenorhabdus]MBD2819342.1 hypothetical protein [Xenorhabdus sp. 42]MBD2826775.1 hypothetical protein [Xenorhabdus sp. 5]PHM32716.1 hypothetical protein Xsze_03463 [Xenorhabdus szentirmaii DSM 16338]CDL81374.1 exported hypothetical protein [Xenorhabdus szentirmaii DSM 16338]
MSYLKIAKKYITFLALMFSVNIAFANDKAVENNKKTENNKIVKFSSYYNMHVRNNSDTAQIEMKRTGYSCMYGAGPHLTVLGPKEKTSFNLETDNGFFQGCSDSDKTVDWTVKYSAPEAEDINCYIRLDTTIHGFVPMIWSTTFKPRIGTTCSAPLKFICDGSETACQHGDFSDENQIVLEVTN